MDFPLRRAFNNYCSLPTFEVYFKARLHQRYKPALYDYVRFLGVIALSCSNEIKRTDTDTL